jgi:hypothetical protein
MPTAGSRVKALDFGTPGTASDATAHNNVTTTPVAGSPTVSVTFLAPTSGMAMIVIGMRCQDDAGSNTVYLDYEVRNNNVSGSVVFATGAVERRLDLPGSGAVTFQPNASKVSIVTGLTPGNTYFVRTMHSAAVTGSADVLMRRLDVIPL